MTNDVFENKKLIILSTLSIFIYFTVGIIFYTQYENFSFLDSMYLITLLLTTVGYGNTVPITKGGKIFTIFYVLCGICFIALSLSILSNYFSNKHERMMIKLLKNNETNLDNSGKSFKHIIIDCIIIFFIIIIVVLFYTLYEDLDIVDAIYMTCISLTTIGFGDIVPTTDGGKIFAIFWILSGTLFFAKIIADYFDYFVNLRQEKIYNNIIKTAIVNYSDLKDFSNNKNTVSRYEFLAGVLVKIGSINRTKIQHIMKQFDNIDQDKNGVLNINDFRKNFPEYAEINQDSLSSSQLSNISEEKSRRELIEIIEIKK